MAAMLLLCLLLFGSAKGELSVPHFPSPQEEQVPIIHIPEDDVREAFSYAQGQQKSRLESENKYIETGNTIPPTELSMDIRIIGLVDPRSVQLDKNQKLFEDATTYLSIKHSLSYDETHLGLKRISLPEDIPAVQQCNELQAHSPCDQKSRYRTADGSCNNLLNPNWGRAFSCLSRLMKNNYGDGLSSPSLSDDRRELPNARLVSLAIVNDKNIPSPLVSQMLNGFGHFVSHDVSLAVGTMAGDSNAYITCCGPNPVPVSELPSICYSVPLRSDDPIFSKLNRTCISLVRYSACIDDCHLGNSRHQVNQHTSFIDASTVYGVSDKETRSLRTLKGGTLLNQFSHTDELPPPSLYPELDQCSKDMYDNHTCIRAGDYRAIQVVGLTSMHIIFFREHNRLAKIISSDYPQLTDEEIFQEVRRIVIAQIQHITYKEMLPLLLGRELMDFFKLNVLTDGYSAYDSKVDPRLFIEHAVTSARFGHSLVQGWYKQFDKDGNEEEELELTENMFRMPRFFEGKMDSITRGLYRQSTQSFDRHFIAPMNEGKIRAPGKQDGIDHVALIIQRGRENGVPPYVDVLQYCYNVTFKSFDDLRQIMSDENVQRFRKAYRDVREIDLYIGGFAEIPIKNSVLGPSFACLLGLQYRNLKFGDSFYYEHDNQVGSFSEGQLKELRKLTLASVVCKNSGVGKSTKNVLRAFDADNPVVECADIPSLNFKNWLDK